MLPRPSRTHWRRPPSAALPSLGSVKVELSEEAREIIEREREAVAARVADLKRESEKLRALGDGVDGDLKVNVRLLRQMDELLGLTPQVDELTQLRGRRLREVAIRVLREKHGAGAAIHYRDWLALLIDSGLRVGGKNPAATFLTQIVTAPEVESVRPRSGLYRLRGDERAAA